MNSTLTVSDTYHNKVNLEYLFCSTEDTVKRLGGKIRLNDRKQRMEVVIEVDGATLKFIRPAVEDKIADVIAVNYKYNYFKKHLRTSGLKPLESEFLLSALISADIDDDKRYVRGKIRGSENYVIDGAFNFTMKPLKEKWAEVVGYIPSVFISEQLKEFIVYLVKDKGGRRVFVDNGKVYDRHFNRLSRTKLTGRDCDGEIIREIILSASGEVELGSRLPEIDEFYLKEFFGDKIFFRKSYFT